MKARAWWWAWWAFAGLMIIVIIGGTVRYHGDPHAWIWDAYGPNAATTLAGIVVVSLFIKRLEAGQRLHGERVVARQLASAVWGTTSVWLNEFAENLSPGHSTGPDEWSKYPKIVRTWTWDPTAWRKHQPLFAFRLAPVLASLRDAVSSPVGFDPRQRARYMKAIEKLEYETYAYQKLPEWVAALRERGPEAYAHPSLGADRYFQVRFLTVLEVMLTLHSEAISNTGFVGGDDKDPLRVSG